MAETAAPAEKPQTLDDLMIAMDVVDTLRHREDLVQRELDDEGREAELIERLRKIYRDQGIEVPDGVLLDGVKALKESRFVYTPPPAGWKRTMLTAWARRQTYGKRVGMLALAVAGVAWAYYFMVARPARLAQEQARIELTETLPKGMRAAHAEVLRIATDKAAKEKADALLADGEREVRAGNRAGIAKTRAELAALRDDLTQEYKLTIVSRPREPSGGLAQRLPARASAKNYYLIVEVDRARRAQARHADPRRGDRQDRDGDEVRRARARGRLRGRTSRQGGRRHRPEERLRNKEARIAGDRVPDAVRGRFHYPVVSAALAGADPSRRGSDPRA